MMKPATEFRRGLFIAISIQGFCKHHVIAWYG